MTCASHGVSAYGCRNTGLCQRRGRAGGGRRLTVHMHVDEPGKERHAAHVELDDLRGRGCPLAHCRRVELLRERGERLRGTRRGAYGLDGEDDAGVGVDGDPLLLQEHAGDRVEELAGDDAVDGARGRIGLGARWWRPGGCHGCQRAGISWDSDSNAAPLNHLRKLNGEAQNRSRTDGTFKPTS